MKIGLDVSQTCVEVAGCGWIAHQIAEALTKLASQECEIILYHHFGHWINTQADKGFNSSNHFVTSPLLETKPDLALQIWDMISKGESIIPGLPDVIHSHNFSAPSLNGVPLIFTVHDLAFWDMPETTTETNRLLCQDGVLQALQNAQAFVFPSKFSETRFLSCFQDVVNRNDQLTKVVPWAGRFQQADEPKLFSPNNPWLFVGSLDPRKNIRNLLHAFERYRDKSTQNRNLLIAGPSGWKTEFETSHIESLTRRGWAKYVGYLSDSDLKKTYREAFALVWPSYYEGFGLPVVEAMTQGTPVITSNRTSLTEVGGGAALYCDPDSVVSISDAMLAMENAEDHYNALSKDCLQQSKQFSWDRTAIDLIDFYKEVRSHNKTRH